MNKKKYKDKTSGYSIPEIMKNVIFFQIRSAEKKVQKQLTAYESRGVPLTIEDEESQKKIIFQPAIMKIMDWAKHYGCGAEVEYLLKEHIGVYFKEEINFRRPNPAFLN